MNWLIVRDWIVGAACGLWRSGAAVVRTTAVWTAVAVIAIGMFVVGHVEGARGKRELRAQIATVTADKMKLVADRDFAVLRAVKAEEALAEARKPAPAEPAASPAKPKPRPAPPKANKAESEATSWWRSLVK